MEARCQRIPFFWIFAFFTAFIVCRPIFYLPASVSAAQDQPPVKTIDDTAPKEVVVAVVPCKGMIDDGLYKSIRRRTTEAIDGGATYLVYEIQTYGGALKSGDDISKYFILEVGKKYHTVAYITTEAISAGSMISVACKDIVMLENTTIGDCAPIALGGTLEGVEREKVESFTRVAFSRAAEANNYPEALLKAMVTRQLEVHQVKNLETGEYEFFETKDLPTDDQIYDIENKKLVVTSDELLTLTALQAKEYGIARTVVKDFDGVLSFLSERDGITFAKKRIVLRTNWSEEMVRWITSPIVMAVLVMLAMLGVYIELNTPGLGLPGLVAVICVVIIVGSKYLIGMANWVEVVIFILGVILLGIEIFVIPGFGLAGFTGILCILAGLFGMLIRNAPGELPWPQGKFEWQIFVDGLAALSLGFVGFLVLAYIFARYLPKMSFLRGLILETASTGAKITPSITTSASRAGKIQLKVGDIGEVVSALRPIGQARFDISTVDVVTEGQFLSSGTRVIITEIHGNRVVVKAAEQKGE
jgi:membrane-bound serine protease (ClpP class)